MLSALAVHDFIIPNSRDSEQYMQKNQEKYSPSLFPASVDKSVHKILLPAKYSTFLHLQHVIA